MAFRGNNQIGQGNKGARRTWTKQEEEALVGILKDLVARGHRCENGSFKPGTNLIIEKALTDTFPTCGLKSTPHIDSKMKVWRKNYSIIFDMVSKSGFRWNDVHKCVEVDSDEVWETYVLHHKEARGWRGKPFPFYDKLKNIFGIDHATGRGIEMPANMVDDCCTTVEISTVPLVTSAEGLPTKDRSLTPREPRVRSALGTPRLSACWEASRKWPCANESTSRKGQSQLCGRTLGRRTVTSAPLSGSGAQTLGRKWLSDRGVDNQGCSTATSLN